jgi:hypothetical protein
VLRRVFRIGAGIISELAVRSGLRPTAYRRGVPPSKRGRLQSGSASLAASEGQPHLQNRAASATDDKNDPHDRNDKAAEDERTRQAVRQSNDRRHGRTH